MTSKLNKTEKYKRQVDLKEYYAKLELLEEASLSEADRFYLKNFGIYNSVLKPEHFMVRIRVPAGEIELKKLRAILDIAVDLKAKITITSRAELELHNLNLKSAIKAHKSLLEHKITTFATLTDNIRNIVTHPLDGIAKDSIFECKDTILQMQEEFIKIENLSKVPRKFNTAISSNIENFEPFFTNDCYFAIAKLNNIYGFKLLLGGKNTNFAKDMDIFVTKEQVAELYKAVVKVYIKYGNRASRTKARLHFLLEELGVDGFKEKLREFFNDKLLSGAILLEKKSQKQEFYELKDNTYAYCYKSNFAEISLDEFKNILDYAEQNSLQIRLGIDQNIYLIGLKNKKIELKSLAVAKNFKVCVGLKYCGFSIYDTKDASKNIDFSRLNRLNISASFSGCLKGCARHIASDFGFVGIRTNLYGTKEFAIRLYLGALYNQTKEPARLIFWAVPLRFLNKMIDTILDEFEQSGYKTFEEFSSKVLSKFSVEFLALHLLQKLDNQNPKPLASKKESQEPSELYNSIKELERKIYTLA